MSQVTPKISAIQIVQPKSDHTFELKIDVLEKILSADDIRDRNVVVVSVAGALRQGKSFLLNFFLQYLYAQYKRNDVSQFLNAKISKGFNWRGGSKPETVGILIWPEIFTYDNKGGDKIAIILMDTQGSFDNESSVRDCSTIFALSAMVSSVLCYNVMRNIREDDLQYLHLFTEYGKLSLEQSEEKPFQSLLFVVRDWFCASEHDFGWKGGQDVVNDRLKKTPKQTEDMKRLRNQLMSSFAEIRGFLLPFPGETVAGDQHFDGNLDEISAKFKNMVKELVPKLLSPENLIIKKIQGQKVRAKDLIQYLKSYVSIFNQNEIPEPKSIFEATAESYNLITYLDAKSKYGAIMKKAIDHKMTFFKDDELRKVHEDAKQTGKTQFKSKPKMGGENLINKYLNMLEQDAAQEFKLYVDLNQKKKQEYSKKVGEKLSALKLSSISHYKTSFEKEFGDTYFSQEKLTEIHLRVKKQAADLFQSRVTPDDLEFAGTFSKQLVIDLEKEFPAFKLKNNEKEKKAMETQRKNDSLKMDSLTAELNKIKQTPRTVNYYTSPGIGSSYSPSPVCYSPPSFNYAASDFYSPSQSSCYSPAPSSYSSGSGSGGRVNYTQSENSRLESLFGRYGNDYQRVASEFNSSRGTSTPRSAKQIQSKCYRMRRNGDID